MICHFFVKIRSKTALSLYKLFSNQIAVLGVIFIPAVSILSGCYASGHKFYDAFKYSPPTDYCVVTWVHSYDAALYKLERELPKVEFLGKSSFTTSKTYNETAAEEDCKKAGGDYIIVVENGYQGSSTSQFTVQSTQTYNTSYNTNYYNSRGGYAGTATTYGTYQVPTYQTYNITSHYYGYTYFVYRRVGDYL